MHGFENDRELLIAESITGGDVLQTDSRGNVAAEDLLALFAGVRVHLKQTSETLLLAGTRVEKRLSAGRRSGINSEEEELADIRVGRNLERESGEGLIIAAMNGDRLFHVVGIVSDGFPDVNRGREVVSHSVEEGLNTFVLES